MMNRKYWLMNVCKAVNKMQATKITTTTIENEKNSTKKLLILTFILQKRFRSFLWESKRERDLNWSEIKQTTNNSIYKLIKLNKN